MKRTTVSLTDDLASALDREVQRRRSSASEITREALAEHLGLAAGQPRDLTFTAIGRSGHSSTARDMESLLEQEWNDKPRRS